MGRKRKESLCVRVCARICARATTGASLPAEKKPSQFLRFWRVLRHWEIKAMPAKCVRKVHFSLVRL